MFDIIETFDIYSARLPHNSIAASLVLPSFRGGAVTLKGSGAEDHHENHRQDPRG